MNRLFSFKSLTVTAILTIALTAAWTSTVHAAGESLTVTFTTSTASGHYAPRNIHVTWIENASGQFVRTIGLWADRRARSFQEWDSTTTSYSADLDARTGATQNGYRQYSVTWDCTTLTGSVIPDGTYTLELELTEEDNGNPRHRATFTWVKGASNIWTPADQGGCSGISIEYQAGGLGVTNTGATNITGESARLNGEATGSGTENPSVVVYWGDNDGGTSPSLWDHEVALGTLTPGPFATDITGLTYGQTYYYRCYVQDSQKGVWAASSESFIAVSTSIVFQEGSTWKYFKGLSNPIGYNQLPFDDSSWLSGPSGFGYGDEDDNTVLSDMRRGYVTVYLRYLFQVDDPGTVSKLIFTVNYDDGFVAFINGTEVARRGIAEGQDNNTEASSHEAGTAEVIDISQYISDLQTGDNVFAIEVHNAGIDSSDLSMIPELAMTGGLAPPQTVITVFPELLTFPAVTVGGSAKMVVHIANNGDTPLLVSELNISGLDADSFTLVSPPTLPLSLPSTGSSQDITVRLQSDIEKTALYAQLAVCSDADDLPVVMVSLTGQSTLDAQIQLVSMEGIGGPACAVEPFGSDKLLVGFGATLCVVDVSDEDNPAILGSVRLGGLIEDIAAFGGDVYVAMGPDGVACVAASDFASPAVLETIDTAGYAHQVAADDSLLAVADGPMGVLVYDVQSGPGGAAYLRTYSTEGPALGVSFPADSARILDEAFGLRIVNLTTASPTLLSDTGGIEFACALADESSVQYVSDKLGRVFVIDGIITHTAHLAGAARALSVSSGRLCAAMGNTGLGMFDLSGGSEPVSLGLYDLSGNVRDVTAQGSTAYVANADQGLQIIDISDPCSVIVKATVNNQAASFGVASGDPTHIAADQRLLTADLSSPAAPALIGSAGMGGQPRDVVVQGDYAYIANGLAGLRIVDISTPSSPTPMGTYPTASFASYVAVADNRVAVSDGLAVYLVNVTNPSSPVEIGVWPSPGWAGGLDIEGLHAYVANGGYGLQILNVSDASAAASLLTPGVAYDVEVHNGLVLVAAGHAGLIIYQMNTPTSLQQVGVFDTCGIANGVAAIGDKVCVSDAFGVTVVDISSPQAPTLYTRSDIPVTAWAVGVAGSRVVVADGTGGLAVLGTESVPRSFAADLDQSGAVDWLDLALLAGNWLGSETSLEPMLADFDNSDTIDFPDFGVLLQHWLEQQ